MLAVLFNLVLTRENKEQCGGSELYQLSHGYAIMLNKKTFILTASVRLQNGRISAHCIRL